MQPLGEIPPLPPALIDALHDRTLKMRKRMSDRCWDIAADTTLQLFEGWKRTHHDPGT